MQLVIFRHELRQPGSSSVIFRKRSYREALETFLYQLKQMGVFQQAAGVLLGTFSELDRSKEYAIETLLMEVADHPSFPIAKTEEIGHGSNAKCLVIEKEYSFRNHSTI